MSLTEPAPLPVMLTFEFVFRVSAVPEPVRLLMPEKEVLPTEPAREEATDALPSTVTEPLLLPVTCSKPEKLRLPTLPEPLPLRATFRLPVARVS